MPTQRNIVNHEFKLQIKRNDVFEDLIELTNVDLKINGTIQEFNPYQMKGWAKRVSTGKSMDVTCTGKFLWGNELHNYFLQLMFGDAVNQNDLEFKIIFPLIDVNATNKLNAELNFIGAINFNGSELMGESNDVSPINLEIKVSNIPVFTNETDIVELNTVITTSDLTSFAFVGTTPTIDELEQQVKIINSNYTLNNATYTEITSTSAVMTGIKIYSGSVNLTYTKLANRLIKNNE